jgi:hypothetical protein
VLLTIHVNLMTMPICREGCRIINENNDADDDYGSDLSGQAEQGLKEIQEIIGAFQSYLPACSWTVEPAL